MAQALKRPHPRFTAGARPQRGPLIEREYKEPSSLSEAPYAHNNSQIRTQISALFHAYQLGLIKNAACRHTPTPPSTSWSCVWIQSILLQPRLPNKMQLIDIHIFQNHRPLRSTDGVHLTLGAQSKQHCVFLTPPELLFPPVHPRCDKIPSFGVTENYTQNRRDNFSPAER